MTGFQQAKCFKESIIVLEREKKGGKTEKGSGQGSLM
jgi:hypothetical protein